MKMEDGNVTAIENKSEADMNNKVIFLLSGMGVAIALGAAYISGEQKKVPPPVFNPAPNPYSNGIYANGMVESYLPSGENINIYPEVAGVVTSNLGSEGQKVSKGTPLLVMDNAVQKATTEQLKSQADAALSLLEELKHQPRKEVLDVAWAQVLAAEASLKTSRVQLNKQQKSFLLSPQSVSQDTLDNAINLVKVNHANVEVARKQWELTKAGAWIYDIKNQEQLYHTLYNAYLAAEACWRNIPSRPSPMASCCLSCQRLVVT